MRKTKNIKKNGPIYILNDFYDKGNDLYLYDSREERRYYVTKSFFQAGMDRNRLCIYAFPKEHDRFQMKDFSGDAFHEIELIRGNIKMLKEEDLDAFYSDFGELRDYAKDNGYEGIHLKIDFGRVRDEIMGEVIELEKKLHSTNGEVPVASISSYNMNFLRQEAVNSLTRLHDRVMITTEKGETSIAFFQQPKPVHIPRIEVISSKMMEQNVKKSLKIIILSLLKQQPMCGFDIIKSLVHNFNVLLSQGTVYPILYSLEKEGYLRTVIKSDNKTKLYVPTDLAYEYIERQIREYIQAQEKILTLIARGLR
ncbi:helix-turn-helix transcriptional regulator [Candidatus Pyrohabitans sp.]